MPEIAEFIEGTPTIWPAAPEGLSDAAAAIPPAAIWSRLEHWAKVRWAARPVEWVVWGSGCWKPPLADTEIETVEIWDGFAWATPDDDRAPQPAPVGHLFPCRGPYRLTGTVGAGEAPAVAVEAYRRLAEYLAASDPAPGSSRYSLVVGDAVTENTTRGPDWIAMAIFNSGAADLLRPLRRVA